MATVCSGQVFLQVKTGVCPKLPFSSELVSPYRFQLSINNKKQSSRLVLAGELSGFAVSRASPANNSITPASDDEEGVSLGTMKLPTNLDFDRFETLLFQV